LDHEAAQLGRPAAVLLEINISGEPTKSGFAPREVEGLLGHVAELRHVEVQGLMGMASASGGLAAAQHDFAGLRQLRDRLASVCPKRISLNELSMGMSGDFEVAIAEGATIVRIGSALLEGIDQLVEPQP
jgi:hypothetical protein